jgi:membrane associated rhomboid family serine protease
MQQIRPSGSFQILPPVIKNLIIINVLVFLAKIGLENVGIDLDYYLGLFYWKSPYFRVWQPITHLFMHGNFTHLLFNMFALWMMGNTVETYLGAKKFMILYLISGLGAAFCQLMVYHFQLAELVEMMKLYPQEYAEFYYHPNFPLNTPMVGASGAVFGVLFAFGYMFPNAMIYLYFAIPIRAKYFVAIYAAIELFSGIRNSVGDNVAHFAHLGGMVFAFFLLAYWKRRGKLFLR